MPKPRQAGLELEAAARRLFQARVPVLRRLARQNPLSRFYNKYRSIYPRSRDRGEINAIIRELFPRIRREAERMMGESSNVGLRQVNLSPIILEIMVGLDALARDFQSRVIANRNDGSRAPDVVPAGMANRAAKRLARRLVTDSRAEMFKLMYVEGGYTSFRWRTRGDSKVRQLHRELDGVIFPTTTGAPGQGVPGHPYNCRCLMEPV